MSDKRIPVRIKIIRYFKKLPKNFYVSTTDIYLNTGCYYASIKRVLSELYKEGFIKKINTKRGILWTWNTKNTKNT